MNKKFFIVLSISLLFLIFTSSPVFAGGVYNLFDGGSYYGSSSDGIGGAKANITYHYKPVVYGTAASGAWSMMAEIDGDNSYFAQVGWKVQNSINNGNAFYFFGYQNKGSGYVEKDVSYGPSIGSSYTYFINKSASTAVGYANGSRIGDANINWVPNQTQYYGEISDYYGNATDAQLPGRTTCPEIFSSVYVWKNSQWQIAPLKFNGTYQSTGSIIGIYDSSYAQSNFFNIWDTRY